MASLPEGFEIIQQGGTLTAKLPPGFEIVQTPTEPQELQIDPNIMARSQQQDPRLLTPEQGIAKQQGVLGAGLIGAGRGFATIGRGIESLTGFDLPGIEPTSPAEERAFKALEEEHPFSTFAGEVVGEAAPFAFGGLVSIPAKIIPRLAAAFGLGAAEGATIAAGKSQAAGIGALTGGGFAAAAELVMPTLAKPIAKIYKRITGKDIDPFTPSGDVKADVKRVLDEAGVSVEQLQDEAISTVKEAASTPEGLARLRAGLVAGESPEMAARASLFDDLGIETTRSRIEQTPESFLEERRLARQVESEPAQDLRERLAAESQGFKDVSERLADDLGYGKDAGVSIKDAVDARRTGEKAKVEDLYDDLKTKSQGRGIPLAGAEIVDVLKDDDVRSLVGRLSEKEIGDLNDRLIEFGIDSNPERAAAWAETRAAKAGGLPTKTEVTPLNVLNYNEFRKSLNNMLGPDSSDELRAVAGRIKEGLDKEINVLQKQLEKGDLGEAGKISLDTIQAAKRATEASNLFKQEFGTDKIVSTLIRPKKGSFDEPMILASELVGKMLSPRDRIGTEEAIESITSTLRKSGEKGAQALGDLQAATVLDLMNFATKAKSAKLDGGVIEWSGVNFGNRFDALGERRLNAIFKDNPKSLNMLKKLRAAGDLKTSFSTVAKSSGTADDLTNFMERMPFFRNLFAAAGGVTAGVGGVVAGEIAEKGAKELKGRQIRKKVKDRLNTSPVLRQQAQTVRLLYPNILAVAGIESVTTEKE